MPRLQVLNGRRQGAVFELIPGVEHPIGHRQTAPISIDDPWVSWDHARVFFDAERRCWIEDVGSTNGTFVNCVRVKRGELKHEDIVFLGKTHVIYLAPADEPAPARSPAAEPPVPGAAPQVAVPAAFARAAAGPTTRLDPARVDPSSIGAFLSDSGLPPLRDPFASGQAPGAGGQGHGPGWPPGPPSSGGGRRRDPFDDSSIDPFASGNDLMLPGAPFPASGLQGRSPGGRGPSPGQRAGSDADRAERAFADTNADGLPALEAPQRSLSLSSLEDREDDGARLPGPSGHEISRLLVGESFDPLGSGAGSSVDAPLADAWSGPSLALGAAPVGPPGRSAGQPSNPLSSGSFDDLDAILGDARARTPDPARFERSPSTPGPRGAPPAGPGPGLGRLPASEMRTRPIDTDLANRILAEADAEVAAERQAAAEAPAPPPPPPPPPPPAQQKAPPATRAPGGRAVVAAAWTPAPQGGQELSSHTPTAIERAVGGPEHLSTVIEAGPGVAPGRPAGGPSGDPGALAFERARLDAEVHRLRAALQAVQAQAPQAVRAAADALRDQELARLGQRTAELERALAIARQELAERQAELDRVTDEMIEKEDRIEALEDEVRRLRNGGRLDVPQALGSGGALDDLTALEF